jgi:protein-tyrosine-phosphatase
MNGLASRESLVKKIRVLFLCSENGVHSPMAEGLLNRFDSEHFEAMSAGIERGETHPLAVKAMSEIGIDLERRIPRGIDDVLGVHFDFVITLSDRARDECPAFPDAEVVHWRFDDPSAALDHSKQARMFQSLREQLAQRIHLFALVQVRSNEVDSGAHSSARFQAKPVHAYDSRSRLVA